MLAPGDLVRYWKIGPPPSTKLARGAREGDPTRMRTTTVKWAALGGLALCACSSDALAPPPAAPVDWHGFEIAKNTPPPVAGPTPRERALAEGYLAGLTSPGFAALGPLLESDVHFFFPGVPEARGRDAVVKAHEQLFGALEQRAVAASRVWRTDGEQTIEWTMTGVANRDWLGVPATHKPVTIKGIALLWTKDDGTLTDVHVVFDPATARAQMGAGPKELAALPAPAMASGAPQVHEQVRTPQEQGLIPAARAWLGGLQAHDDGAYLSAVTDDITVETLERAQPLHGKDDVRAHFKALRRSIGQLDVTVTNSWAIGQFAILEYAIAGAQQGPVGWVPAQRDKVVRLHEVDVMELRDGKVAHVWRYDNPGEIVGTGP